MSNSTVKKPLVAAIGAAVVGSLAATGAVAADNPFGLKELTNGYMQVAQEGTCGGAKSTPAKDAEGKCGEGKCGSDMGMEAPAKTAEGKCGGSKTEPAEGKCGGTKTTEGKCGGNK